MVKVAIKAIRCVLIDPKREDISEITCPTEDYSFIADAIGCDCFTIALMLGNYPVNLDGHVLYVDDEGLLKDQKHHFRFKWGALPVNHEFQWLAGRGLIVKSEFDPAGEEIEVNHTVDLDWLRDSIQFLHGRNPTDPTPRIFSI